MSRTIRAALCVVAAVAALLVIAPQTSTVEAADGYWNRYWNWYDNDYRPYYSRRYYYRRPYYYGRDDYYRGWYDNDGLYHRRYPHGYYERRGYYHPHGEIGIGPFRLRYWH